MATPFLMMFIFSCGQLKSVFALSLLCSDTANLASLLVDTKSPRLVLENIEDAVALGVPLCVYENTGADAHIKLKYKQARRVPFQSELKRFKDYIMTSAK